MNPCNLFIQFSNGTSSSYEIEIRSSLKKFQDDFVKYLSTGKQPASALKAYEVKQGETKLFLSIDFSKITSVSILDDGGQPG
ncbi:MAG: hypothetical protein PHY62_09160 [Gallionella sp.]|nr:hypothetical protein [Gallionella sp.]